MPSLLDGCPEEAPERRDQAVRTDGPPISDPFRCCICGQASVLRFFQLSGYWIRRVPAACGHQFVELSEAAHHVEQQFGDDYFTRGGADTATISARNDCSFAAEAAMPA